MGTGYRALATANMGARESVRRLVRGSGAHARREKPHARGRKNLPVLVKLS